MTHKDMEAKLMDGIEEHLKFLKFVTGMGNAKDFLLNRIKGHQQVVDSLDARIKLNMMTQLDCDVVSNANVEILKIQMFMNQVSRYAEQCIEVRRGNKILRS